MTDQRESEEDIMQNVTAPNPDGFFSDLTDENACSVAVAVRVRPLIGRESVGGQQKECVCPDENDFDSTKLQIAGKSFNFDSVFFKEATQEAIFDKCTRNLVLGTFHGYNATILAYGQTGSGKTHTMGTGCTIGIPFENVGIVPRVFKFIFDEIDMRKAQSEYSSFRVCISFLELYNEEIHDLLDPSSMVRDKITGKPAKEVQIREEKNGHISVRGLKEQEVSTQDECLHWLNMGINHRVTSATLMNEGSSRSHAIFTVTIEQKIIKEVDAPSAEEGKKEDGPATVTEEISAKFHFVDLAGSERIKKTGASGKLMKEGISINKGLLCLGQVISALTDEKRAKEHIPYRDSKLTRILQDSLGGNSRTTMIACVSPAESNYEESLGTIKYASRARNIKNKPIVNRDPNSMLIESLRNQITTLQFEVKEYVYVITSNGLSLPNNLQERAFEKQKTVDEKRRQSIMQERPAAPGGTANAQEVKDLKIKLSHKDKEIRELQQKLKDNQVFMDKKDKQIKETEQERDSLAVQIDALQAKLKENNIEFDGKAAVKAIEKKEGGPAVSNTLIEQYKAKLQKAQREIDQKMKELMEKDNKINELKQHADRNDKMLKKHMQENTQLKKQVSSGGGMSAKLADSAEVAQKQKPDFKTLRAQRKQNTQKTIEEFNQQFLSGLQDQIDELLTNAASRREKKLDDVASISKDEISQDLTRDQTLDQTNTEDEGKQIDAEVAEKEKLLAGVRQYALNMSSDIKDLLKNEWGNSINSIESQMKKAENDHKENVIKAKDDSKKLAAIEREHQIKMESMSKEVAKLETEKKKKEESVAKQIALQEARIKALEADLNKQKLKREEVERAKKYDENRFFQFKQHAQKDLASEKKKISDKEKEMSKLKNEMKKVDQLAQQKIAQLRGLQKKAKEEREVRAKQEQQELESRGIDIDLIKDWITRNTDAMLKNQELKEYQQKQLDEKDKIESEMMEEGDRMTELLITKEKLEMEKEELEEAEGEKDEGRLLEIEDNLKEIILEIGSITNTLDMLDETLEFVQSRLNQVTEEIESFDLDSVQPLSFNALESIESAKATLKTFFQVVLDLNVYKRDIENKCIEQDEQIIQLQASVNTAEARVKYMIEHGGNDGYAASVAKQQAIHSALQQVDYFVDNRDVEHLNLNKTEQANLTKLSLSKIVNNLKNKLKEQETKNQQVTLKLDSALKEKQIYKQKLDELKREQKNQMFGQQQNMKNNMMKPPVPATKGMAFKDRQKMKQQQPPVKQVESLADRRKAKKSVIEQEDSQALETQLDRLKNNNLLEEIREEEIPEVEFEDDQNEGKDLSRLEPDQNISQLMANDASKMSAEQGEDWIQENLLNLSIEMNAKLVDYFFMNSKMICVYEDFQVQEIDIAKKEVVRSFNLQEVEGFEISENVEEDKVVAFTLEKDVMLVSVACMTTVHVFEYQEEEDICLGQIAVVEKPNITSLLFVNYHLIMVQDLPDESKIEISLWDPDSEKIIGSTEINKDQQESKIQLQSGSECIYFTAGTILGKIELPSLNVIFKTESGHRATILDMVVTNLNQIVTASEDGDIRFFNTINGQKAGQPLQEMECDHLATQGIHLLTRIGKGEAMLVWKLLPTGGVQEEPVGEVELDPSENEKSVMFNMKSGVSVNQEGVDSEELIMMNLFPNQVKFNILTRS